MIRTLVDYKFELEYIFWNFLVFIHNSKQKKKKREYAIMKIQVKSNGLFK